MDKEKKVEAKRLEALKESAGPRMRDAMIGAHNRNPGINPPETAILREAFDIHLIPDHRAVWINNGKREIHALWTIVQADRVVTWCKKHSAFP